MKNPLLFCKRHAWQRFQIAFFVMLLLATLTSLGQTRLLTQGQRHLEITLELQEGTKWRAVDPGRVFQQDDQVRFRVRPNFAGYLYVMNQSTSGHYATLFPREDTGQNNKLEADQEYLVPATEGWFRITGPPGQEIVYWMVSPVALLEGSSPAKSSYTPLPPPPKPGKLPPNLIPRCDDTIFKARGDCIDASAGVKGVSEEEDLPENLAAIPGADSRELTFVRNENSTLVSSPASLTSPVIFEFRLAHR